ncbi:MAG: hypothetical protein KJ638_10100 [Chloroflexi bacterium]|nr:hypothetical protein [Chloroflexota bacterium]
MNKSCLLFWLTRLSWGLLVLDLVSIFLVPADTDFGSLALMLVYAGWLILTLVGATTWLMVAYRGFFQTWHGWTLPVSVLVLNNLVSAGVFPISNPNLAFFFTLLNIVSAWAVGVATVILLWYRDAGLRLVALVFVIFVWTTFLAWHFQGNLIEILFLSVNRPNEPSPLWWLNPLFCIFWWVIPLGLISFVGHTLRILAEEAKGDSSQDHHSSNHDFPTTNLPAKM